MVTVRSHLGVVLDAGPTRGSRRRAWIVVADDQVLATFQARQQFTAVSGTCRHKVPKMPDIVIWPDYLVPALDQRGIVGNHIGERAAVEPKDTSVTEMSVACEVYHREKMELIGCAPRGCADGEVTLGPKVAKRNVPKFRRVEHGVIIRTDRLAPDSA